MRKKMGNAVLIGVLAGFAAWMTAAEQLNLPTWVLFVCWACYFLFGSQPRASGKGLFQLIIGIFLGALTLFVAPQVAPALGVWTFPVLVFLLAFGMAFLEWTPLNNIAAYYIGVTIMFGSGFSPDPSHLLKLLICVALAFAFGWAYVTARTALFAMIDNQSCGSQPAAAAP